MRIAKATRVGGNIYDVSYSDCSDYDRYVHYSYLLKLAQKGYQVEVDQSENRGEGEPKQYVIQPV